jgi:hypothetical protein
VQIYENSLQFLDVVPQIFKELFPAIRYIFLVIISCVNNP